MMARAKLQRTQVWFLVGCLGVALGGSWGCDDTQASAEGGAAEPSAVDEGSKDETSLELESRTVKMSGFEVTIDAPAGWKEQEFGGGLLLTKPGGVMGSTMTIAPTCEGDCSTIADNLTGMAAEQVKMHAGYYPTAKVVEDGPVDAGGHAFELELAQKDGRTAVQYKLVRYEEGWPKGINCTAMLLGDDASMLETLKKACNGMKIAAKG